MKNFIIFLINEKKTYYNFNRRDNINDEYYYYGRLNYKYIKWMLFLNLNIKLIINIFIT